VRISNAVGYADFRDLRPLLPTAGSSAGTAAFLAELDTTFKQFTTVRRTVYSMNGDVAAFYEWLQLSPPEGSTMPPLAEARRVARAWMAGVAGMRNITVQGSQWRSDFIATVDVRSLVGESRSVPGPRSRVVLGRSRTSFSVLGVTTETIVVERPAEAITPSALAVVTSPLTISGRALAFEGTVSVRVLQVRNGTVRQLGSGHVIGGGDVMRPFTGEISFAAPSADIGWVLASELSAYNGAVTKVTAVRVAFTRLAG
jgi:Immunoglobulin-like domain of bacterial spore germination